MKFYIAKITADPVGGEYWEEGVISSLLYRSTLGVNDYTAKKSEAMTFPAFRYNSLPKLLPGEFYTYEDEDTGPPYNNTNED